MGDSRKSSTSHAIFAITKQANNNNIYYGIPLAGPTTVPTQKQKHWPNYKKTSELSLAMDSLLQLLQLMTRRLQGGRSERDESQRNLRRRFDFFSLCVFGLLRLLPLLLMILLLFLAFHLRLSIRTIARRRRCSRNRLPGGHS